MYFVALADQVLTSDLATILIHLGSPLPQPRDRQIAVLIHANRLVVCHANQIGIGARPQDEIVLNVPPAVVIDQVDSGVNILVADPRVVRYARMPILLSPPDEVAADTARPLVELCLRFRTRTVHLHAHISY